MISHETMNGKLPVWTGNGLGPYYVKEVEMYGVALGGSLRGSEGSWIILHFDNETWHKVD